MNSTIMVLIREYLTTLYPGTGTVLGATMNSSTCATLVLHVYQYSMYVDVATTCTVQTYGTIRKLIIVARPTSTIVRSSTALLVHVR